MSSEIEHKLSIAEYRNKMRKSVKDNDGVLAIICAFYLVVHSLEWYFARKYRYHPRSHVERGSKLYKCLELDSITEDYDDLYNLSLDVRYRCKINTLKPSDIKFAVDTAARIETLLKSLYSDFPCASVIPAPSYAPKSDE
jgi:hypothetical protein